MRETLARKIAGPTPPFPLAAIVTPSRSSGDGKRLLAEFLLAGAAAAGPEG